MVNCRNCVNWRDESLQQIEADGDSRNQTFMGCRIFGFVENSEALESCKHYAESENLFTICGSCGKTVPKVCVSLGECVNCIDTDLFCIEHCIGGDCRKYCAHFVPLHAQGIQLIDKDQVFDLFPTLGMPGRQDKKKGE